MQTVALNRLQYAAAIACGVFAALTVLIIFTVLDFGLGTVLRAMLPSNAQQLVSAFAWWTIGASGFVAGWATGASLTAAAREREFVYLLARRFLIALVLAICTAAGLLSKSGNVGGGADVLAGLAALGVGLLTAICGARLAYLNAESS